MTDFAWAIIGPGRIAHRFPDAVFRLPGTHLRSVLGRDPAAAAQFAAHWCRSGKPSPRAVANLSSLLADDTLEAVYIATPHSEPFRFMCARTRCSSR